MHSLEVKFHPLPYPLPHNEDYVQSNKVKKNVLQRARYGLILYLFSVHISGAYLLINCQFYFLHHIKSGVHFSNGPNQSQHINPLTKQRHSISQIKF